MKKILVVLTILVLVAGSAFAALSGSVEAKYDFDFDKPAVKYSVGGANAKLAFTLTTEAVSVTGETKPYAVVTAGLELGGAVDKNAIKTLAWDSTNNVYTYKVAVAGSPAWKFSLKEFKIVGENWELDFIKSIGVGNYAKSPWEVDETDDALPLSAAWNFVAEPGVTFTYDGFSVGIAASAVAATPASKASYDIVAITWSDIFGLDYVPYVVYYTDLADTGLAADSDDYKALDAAIKALAKAYDVPAATLFHGQVKKIVNDGAPYDSEVYTGDETIPVKPAYYIVGVEAGATAAGAAKSFVNLRAESKDLVLGDNVTAKFAAAAGISKADAHADIRFDFGVSAKAAYTTDELTVAVAADLQKYNSDKVDFDATLNVAVAPVTVDVFYANKIVKDSRYGLITNKTGYISFRAIVDLAKITSTDVKVYLYADNVLNLDRLFGIKEEGTFGKLSENAQFGIYPGIAEKVAIWFANGEVAYEVAENLKVYAGVGAFDFVADTTALYSIAGKVGATYTHELFKVDGAFFCEYGNVTEKFYPGFKATISSDKLVEKAVLSATLLINKNTVVEAYDATRSLDDFTLTNVDTSEWSFEARNALTLSCKVAF